MRKVFVLFIVAFTLTATVYAQEYEPNWGEIFPFTIDGQETPSFWYSAWSPDGSTVAFTTNPKKARIHNGVLEIIEGYLGGVWLVDADGGKASLIYQNDEGALYRDLSFTPDGTKLIFSYQSVESSENDFDRNDIIASVNVTTGAYHKITTGWHPALSSSGRYICARKSNDDRHNGGEMTSSVVIYDTVTGDEATLIEASWDEIVYLGHSFLPDESAIILSCQDRYMTPTGRVYGDPFLYRIPLTGGEPEEIDVTDTEGFRFPLVHPDGRNVIFTEGPSLKMVNIFSGEVVNITPDGGGRVQFPALSSDGMRIIYRYHENSDGKGGTPKDIRIITLDESLFDEDDGPATAVESDVPAAFPILVSYPNPFNPTTTISFTLPDAGYAELAVYNLAGQKIRTLVAGELSPGVHEVVWDGRNDADTPVSSGVFVSRLITGDTVVSNRMTLVK